MATINNLVLGLLRNHSPGYLPDARRYYVAALTFATFSIDRNLRVCYTALVLGRGAYQVQHTAKGESMAERYYEERHFIEDIALYFEQMGLPRMAGRVLGVLLISDPPAQSINDLSEILHASKSSISTTTRLLTEMGLIERVASPLPRRVYFQFRTGGWVTFIRQRLSLWASLHQLAEQGLNLIRDQDPALRDRLQEAHDIFSLIEEQLPALLEQVEHERRR